MSHRKLSTAALNQKRQEIRQIHQRLHHIQHQFENLNIPMQTTIVNSETFNIKAPNTKFTLSSKLAHRIANQYPMKVSNDLALLLDEIQVNLLTYDQTNQTKWTLIATLDKLNQIATANMDTDEPCIQTIESIDHASQETYLPFVIRNIQSDLVQWENQSAPSTINWEQLHNTTLNSIISLIILNYLPKYRKDIKNANKN